MWVIVAVTLSFGGTTKMTVIQGREYDTKDECLQDVRVRGNFDSQAGGGGLDFSICVPKGSLQLGPSPNPR
jgi:hypothetical protein